MDDRTQGALLLAVGGVSLRLGLTDAALAYVKAGLQPLLTAGGAVLVVLGMVALVRAFRRPPADAHPEPHDDGHGHGDHGPLVAWLLVLPLLALLLIAPPPLGSFAASRQSTRPPTLAVAEFGALPDPVGGAVELPLSEYVFRALYDPDESLADERVRLTGFVTPHDEPRTDSYLLTRFLLSCCAADGQAINVEVTNDTARGADTWLEIEGHWVPRAPEGDEPVTLQPPLFVADQVREIPAPSQPYEY